MRRLPLACLLAIVAALGAMSAAVAAPLGPSRDLERLQVELEQLRQVIPVQASDASRLARFEVRLEQLEEEIRRLTGRVERLEFQDRQLNQRFDSLVGDLDERLRGLEQAVPNAEEATPGDEEPFPPEVPLSQGGGVAAAQPPEPTAREGELGTIPESALLGLPRPDPNAATPPERSSLPPEEHYEQAMNQLRAGDYAAAERGLELFVELNPEHPLAANAAYWLAETHYVRRNYAAAAAAFARNYRTYGRDAAKAVDNLLKLGMSLQGLGESDKACLSFAELQREFPSAPAHILQAVDRERQRAECA